jgi:hypothetical protein
MMTDFGTTGYLVALNALHAVLQEVTGIQYAMIGEPTSIQAPALIWSMLAGSDTESLETIKRTTYRTEHTVAIRWQDSQAAELELLAYIDSIPAAVDRDPTLGGVVRDCEITSAEAGFVTVGEQEYRTLAFTSEVVAFSDYGYRRAGTGHE